MNRKIKRIFGISMLILTSVAFISGCGKGKNNDESTQSEAETQPGEKDELNAVTGEVLSLSGHKLKIETYENEGLTFFIEGAVMKGEKNIDTGNPVTVVYYGDILDDGDTSEIMVEMVIAMDKDTVASFEPGKEVSDSEDGDGDSDNESGKSEGSSTMSGIVIEYTKGGNLILENAEDGIYYYFDTANARVKDPEAVVPGVELTVDYKGDVYGSEVVTAKKLTLGLNTSDNTQSDKADADDTEDDYDDEDKGSASLESESIIGTIKNMTQNTVTIETKAGKRYKFSIMDAEIEPEGGLKKGMYVTLYYEGNLEEGAENVEIKRVEEA